MTPTSLTLLRSNAIGELVIPFLERQGIAGRFRVVAGGRKSADIELQSGAEVQEIVLR
jgi:hypothetical protein